jgi:hypothetical protein
VTWKAFVEDDWMADGFKIGLADVEGPAATYVHFDGVTFERVTDRESGLSRPYDPLRLPEAAARALLDALLTQFRMTRADENLRVDYLAERARVDKLIDAAIRPSLPVSGADR